LTDKVAALVKQINDLEDELEHEFERRRKAFNFRIEQGRVIFEQDILKQQKAIRQRLRSYIAGARVLVVLTAPVIYSMIVPLVFLDVFVTIYQAICFPVYKIPKTVRADYITFDRKHLSYLNGLEKLNCIYCSYGNGVLAFTREIAARTELYWCPIKHAKRMSGLHHHYPEFAEYGDAEQYQSRVRALRGTTQNTDAP